MRKGLSERLESLLAVLNPEIPVRADDPPRNHYRCTNAWDKFRE